MPHLRISEADELLGVSDDTVRRMADSGRLDTAKDSAGRLTVSGKDLAAVAREIANPPPVGAASEESARNRMRGIMTCVMQESVMALVEMAAGPFRIVSLVSRTEVRTHPPYRGGAGSLVPDRVARGPRQGPGHRPRPVAARRTVVGAQPDDPRADPPRSRRPAARLRRHHRPGDP